MDTPQGGIVGLAVALGAGLLIGIDRERRKGRGDDRQAAGLRSFTVVAVTGALAQWLPVPGLVVCGAGLVAVLGAVSYLKSRSRDPGLTTELALFTTYLIGVQCVLSPAFGGACGVGLAALLAARERLHRFATQLLSEQELHDGLLLAAFGLIVLPLIPSGPLPWLGGIDPRPLASMVLLILAIQAAGHVALRWLGPRGGLLLSGLVSGFVSSTATVASFGSRARAHPDQMPMLAGGGALSSVATWLQAVVMSSVLSPGAALAIGPVALAGALGGTAVSLLALRSRDALPPADPTPLTASALRPREAMAIALLLGVVALGVGSAQRHFGHAGLNASIAIASLVDAHAPVASLASLHAAGRLTDEHMVLGVLIAITTNSISRCAVAAFAGGRSYALRVGAALVAGLAAAWTVGLVTGL
ncbi:MAG: MgtC/SapB family protein [Rhizobacter sp.]